MRHQFENIGEASAAMVIAALSSNPSMLFLTKGILGKFTFLVLKILFMYLASIGLIALNVGAEKLKTISDADNFEDSFTNAEAMIKKIRDAGNELTPEQIAEIDNGVIDAFRKFAKLAKPKKEKVKANEKPKKKI